MLSAASIEVVRIQREAPAPTSLVRATVTEPGRKVYAEAVVRRNGDWGPPLPTPRVIPRADNDRLNGR